MNLQQQQAAADELAARIEHDRQRAGCESKRLHAALAEIARQPATLAWSFAAGTVFSARDRTRDAPRLRRVAATARLAARMWGRLRLLDALTDRDA